MKPTFIDIEGRRYAWKDLVRKRQEQLLAARRKAQPVLFDLRVKSLGTATPFSHPIATPLTA